MSSINFQELNSEFDDSNKCGKNIEMRGVEYLQAVHALASYSKSSPIWCVLRYEACLSWPSSFTQSL